jgi:hypothetical protein
VLVLAAAAGGSARPTVEGLELRAEESGLRVSFRVAGALSDEVLERVHSGIRLDFEHRVEILGRRVAVLFPRRRVARTDVITAVHYDSLTRRYELERSVAGRGWPKDLTPPVLVEHRSTSSVDEMRAWMTEIGDVPLPNPPPEAGTRFKVAVRTALGVRFLLLMLPWPDAATGELWVDL